MATFTWSNALSVNIQELDLQHRHLVELIAGLEDAVEAGAGKQALGDVLRELNSYAREHFTLEERMMATRGYPDLQQHAAQHEVFVDKLLHYELDYLGDRIEITREVLDFLIGWLKEHVADHDQLYARYFLDKGLV